MSTLFGFSFYVSFLLFACLGLVVYGVSLLLLKLYNRRAARDPSSFPIGAFIGTISTAWALSLGFVAADVWAISSRADFATTRERSAILRLLATAHPDVLNKPELKQAVENYRDLVVSDEWRAHDNVEPSEEVEKAILAIRVRVRAVAMDGTPAPIVTQLVNDFDELQDARNDRLAVASSSVDEYKWYLVVALTFLTAAAIAATHADRPQAGKQALLLYSLAASISLWILAIHANPYTGAGQIEPAMLYSSQR